VPHLRIFGKGAKVRYVPAHPLALERIHDYLEAAGHGEDVEGPLFRPLKNPSGQGRTVKNAQRSKTVKVWSPSA
jgi:integrase